MDTEITNIKNILLVEDDPRDVELTLALIRASKEIRYHGLLG
jgi:hypothetical protein